MKKCAICRAADAGGCFHGKKLYVPICDRCMKIGAAFISTGYIGFDMKLSPEELGGSSLIDSLLRNLRNRGLVEEDDVMEVLK